MRRIVHKTVFAIMSFAAGSLIHGCGPCHKIPASPRNVEGQPFTYRLVGPGHLLRAYAYEGFELDSNLPPDVEVDPLWGTAIKIHWEIIARKPVRARGFEVTIGKVPEGFEQIVPPPEVTFTPVPGKNYYFYIETDWPFYQWRGGLKWRVNRQ